MAAADSKKAFIDGACAPIRAMADLFGIGRRPCQERALQRSWLGRGHGERAPSRDRAHPAINGGSPQQEHCQIKERRKSSPVDGTDDGGRLRSLQRDVWTRHSWRRQEPLAGRDDVSAPDEVAAHLLLVAAPPTLMKQPRRPHEAALLQGVRARQQRHVEPLLKPLLRDTAVPAIDDEPTLRPGEAKSARQQALQRVQSQAERAARREAARLRAAEMAMLEARLTQAVLAQRAEAVFTQRAEGEPLLPLGAEADSFLEEEELPSIVQHRSINRDLPWQVYAKRPVRGKWPVDAEPRAQPAELAVCAVQAVRGGDAAAGDAKPRRLGSAESATPVQPARRGIVLRSVYDDSARPQRVKMAPG
jgi:hypothetical protein